MNSFDVLIIGGGPAGSTLAYSLRGSGLRIGILDKMTFPRQKVCAGWVTPEVMRLLNIDLDDYASGRVLQKISGFRISQIGQPQVESNYPDGPVSYGIRRIEFDDYLLQRCGAELLLGEPFADMVRSEDGWLVNGHISARLVVGAGGHFCPVARAIGAKGVSEVAVAAQEVEFRMTPEQKSACTIREDIPELFFTPDLAGYGWIFRKGDFLNIGLGREDKSRLSGHVQRFCDYLTRQHKLPGEIHDKFNGHAYLLYPHAVRHMIADNVLLIGDAAGLAYPQSGEGIRPAVESAILAGDVIRECAGDYSKNRLQAYNDLIVKRFGERQPTPRLLERLPLPVKQFFARRLLNTRWFTRKVVTDHWFLQAHQPPLHAINK
jgi:flavin-dependent dehydrogenase